MNYIDLRSDTVTKPTPAMRAAMASAEVGDDGYGDDPTINELQRRAAAVTGKEDALFLPSGTMANLCGIMSHTRHSDSVIIGEDAHSWMYESGGPAAIAGVLTITVGRGGTYTWKEVEPAIRPRGIVHLPPTTLIMLENTHNCGGGIVFPQDDLIEIAERARALGIATHLDGARIFNAAAATGKSAAELARPVDSISFCLSKGLGCPIGSLVCGSKDFILRARRFREMLGGGMRQAGIVAAAGLYALDHNIERLKDDHAHARLLAEKLSDLPGLAINLAKVQTNMVFAEVKRPGWNAFTVAGKLSEKGVLVGALSPYRLRAVCHLQVSREDVLKAAEAFAETMAG
jgi:threonine aldolase